jgi:hypothetical protein
VDLFDLPVACYSPPLKASFVPLSSASSAASPSPPAEFKCSTLDFQGFAGHEGFSHNTAGSGENATVSMSGYLHHIGSRFLVQMFKITQPNRFQLLDGHKYFSGDTHAVGDKGSDCWITGYEPGFFGSRH